MRLESGINSGTSSFGINEPWERALTRDNKSLGYQLLLLPAVATTRTNFQAGNPAAEIEENSTGA